MKPKILFLLLFITAAQIPFVNHGQEKAVSESSERQFRSVSLLDSYAKVMEKLKNDTLILVDPDSDFGDFDEENPELIKAKIPSYIDHLYYQFFKGNLFALSLFFNPGQYSYLEIYRQLKKKFGNPKLYDAENAVWETEKTLIILDKLPSLKYIDKESFNQIREKNKQYLFQRDIIKEKILEGL